MRPSHAAFLRNLALILCLAVPQLFGAPFTYLFRANVNADLGGTAVAGPFTLAAQGDTADAIFSNGNWWMVPTSVTIDVAGHALTLDPTSAYLFDNPLFNVIGFGMTNIPRCCDLIQQQRSEYLTYDLHSSIGPLPADANLSLTAFIDVPTSGGLLTVRSMESNSFEAIPGTATPEPASIALIASSVALLSLLRRRHT